MYLAFFSFLQMVLGAVLVLSYLKDKHLSSLLLKLHIHALCILLQHTYIVLTIQPYVILTCLL